MHFFTSLKTRNRIIQVEKIGISENTLIFSFDLDFNITELVITTYKGEEIMTCSLKSSYDNNSEQLPLLKNYSKSIAVITNENKGFTHISFGNYNITGYRRGIIIFICLSQKPSCSNMIKLYLEFMSNAFFNFIGVNNDILKENNLKAGVRHQAKLFELFFVYSLTKKLARIIKFIISKKEIKTDVQEKIRNIYLIDLSNGEVLFDMRKVLKKKKNTKFKYQKQIWERLNIIANESNQNALKFELTSTFPRIMFIVKFLSISNGLAIIEVFSSYRLSRDEIRYKEFALTTIYDYEANIAWTKCKEFDSFVKEYLTLVNNGSGKYHNESNTLKYFDYEILTVIDNTLIVRMSFDNLISLLKKKFLYLLNQRNSCNIQGELLNDNEYNSTSIINGVFCDVNNPNKNQSFLNMETDLMLSEIAHRGCRNSIALTSLNKTINDELGKQISDISKYNVGTDPDNTLINSTFLIDNHNNSSISSNKKDFIECINKGDDGKKKPKIGSFFQFPQDLSRTSAFYPSKDSMTVSILKKIQSKIINFDEKGNYFKYDKKQTLQIYSIKEKTPSKRGRSDMENNVNHLILNEYYINIQQMS